MSDSLVASTNDQSVLGGIGLVRPPRKISTIDPSGSSRARVTQFPCVRFAGRYDTERRAAAGEDDDIESSFDTPIQLVAFLTIVKPSIEFDKILGIGEGRENVGERETSLA